MKSQSLRSRETGCYGKAQVLRLVWMWLYTLVKMIENGIGDKPRCFAVGKVTHILQRYAAITAGEERFESF